jgi:hypothetical protein
LGEDAELFDLEVLSVCIKRSLPGPHDNADDARG